ncbi:hypothetical protein [Eikenella sp. Marseille-P7795]|nr:hypothetical protein [Eikenella sp. Marseille-P7795]
MKKHIEDLRNALYKYDLTMAAFIETLMQYIYAAEAEQNKAV